MKIAIIGRGNVAGHLAEALAGKADAVVVNPHTLEELPDDADIILISVNDDAIREVALKCVVTLGNHANTLIAHTSGSVGIEVLNGCSDKTGVFYPLQTFSRNVPLEYHEIPFFIEGSDTEASDRLADLARMISGHVYEADSDKRRRLHIAAVFACNFSNYLVSVADTLLQEQDMDYRVLLPLLKETVRKLEKVSPADAQTGPAARGDRKVITKHLQALSPHPDFRQIYSLLSESIINTSTGSRLLDQPADHLLSDNPDDKKYKIL